MTSEHPFSTNMSLRPALQKTVEVLNSRGGRITAPELQVNMRIGLSTAYTYLNELYLKGWLDRVKIQSSKGTGKQFLYILKTLDTKLFTTVGKDLPKAKALAQKNGNKNDPMKDVLEVLRYLSQRVNALEMKLAQIEQASHKDYPLLHELKKEIFKI